MYVEGMSMKQAYRLSLFCVLQLLLLFTTDTFSQITAWRKKFDGQGFSLGINPVNPHTIYTEGNDNRLYVSRNQGQTWSQVSSWSLPYQLREILVHPNDTLTIFAVNFSDGLLRTRNGGLTWDTVIVNYGIDGESVCYDPLHPDTMYAGNFGNAAIYRSMNRGATWSFMGFAGSSDICGLAVRPDSANILYAGTGSGTISKSTNSGVTWYQVKSGGSSEIPRIVVNPVNPQIAYATGFYGNVASTGVWKTTDGGQNWFLTALANKSMWSIDIDPRHPNTLYSGTFDEYNASVYRTTDAGASWTQLDKGFLAYNSMWNLHLDPLDSTKVYVGVTNGSFGAEGVFRLESATAGAAGQVRDSLNNHPIISGTVQLTPAGDVVDLSYTQGTYAFYRYSGDTTSVYNINVYINSQLFAQKQITLINDSVLAKDIIVQPGEIRGNLFDDRNSNGVRDAGEPGLSGWIIKVGGQSTLTVQSDTGGHYLISDLFPGTYNVSEQSHFGWVRTFPGSSTYSLPVSMGNKFYSSKDFGNHVSHRVVSVSPASGSSNNPGSGTIRAVFDTVMDVTSFSDTNSWKVWGSSSGRHRGSFIFDPADTSVTFTPADTFWAGEVVTVDISNKSKTAIGSPITAYWDQFTIGLPPATGKFMPKVDYLVGSGPWALAVADVNKDGRNDIVVANANSNTVSVLINNGNGTFAAGATYITGLNPRAVAVGDLNNDGYPDIVVANNGFTNVTVLKNNGDGTFGGRADISAGGNPSSVALADLDGDGNLDIVITNTNSNTLAVLTNDGAGNFPSLHSFASGTAPWWSAIADMNRDGGVDVVVANSLTNSTLSILSNIGSGNVALNSSFGVGSFSRGVAAADFNNDGRLDLIAPNSTSNTVSLYPQDGSGNFGPRTDLATGAAPWAVATGDLDGDGLLDFCISNATANTLSVYQNGGGTSFTRTDLPTGLGPHGVAIADLDGDGDLDVVVANTGSSTVSVYLNSIIISSLTGWNLISIPTEEQIPTKSAIFPNAVSRAFAYAGGYVPRDTLTHGPGYWVKIDTARTLGYDGHMILSDNVPVSSGWNLVGSLGRPFNTSTITSSPPGIVASAYFGFNGSYQIATSITPGEGYWVKTSAAGTLQTNAPPAQQPRKKSAGSDELAMFNSLVIEDNAGHRQTLYFSSAPEAVALLPRYGVPPPPPERSFYAHFAAAGARLAEAVRPNGRGSFPIKISNASYPLVLTWTIKTDETRRWVLSAGAIGKEMTENGKLIVPADEAGSAIRLEALSEKGSLVPSEFALDQNFPNPFNPSTELRYQLSGEGHATLTIHNVLGQEVARLADADQPAGYYAIRWDAANRPSGVYYARLTVSSQTGKQLYQTARKLLLMR